MTASARRTVIVTMAGLAVAVLLVWSAATGPVDLAEGFPQRPVVTDSHVHADRPAHTEPVREPHHHGTTTQTRLGTGLGWVDDAVGIAVFLAGLLVLGALLRALLGVVGAALPEKQLVIDLDPLPDGAAGREAVRRDRDRLTAALGGVDVRDGIVACWVVLEEDAAEAGVRRLPSETSTEFVVRFLHLLDVDPRPVAALAELYREARFSTHPMGEDARRRAAAALAAVHEELAVSEAGAGAAT